jgi:tetratricopeptide (TPR) repeat protein
MEQTPEQHAALARQAMAGGDLSHALFHLGSALASEPMHKEWLPMMQHLAHQVSTTHPDPLSLVPEGDMTYVQAANRSWVLAYLGRWVEALDLITDVADVRPDIPYLLWAEWWFNFHGVAQSLTFEQLSDGILVDLANIAVGCPVPIEPDDPRLPNLQAAARLMATVRQLHPQRAFTWFVSGMVARRTGTTEESLGWAQYAYQLEPSWKNAIGVANTVRDLRRLDEAAAWYARARSHDPEDVSAHLDCGDMFLEAERYDEAIAQYEAAQARKPDHPWATASIAYARFRGTGNLAHKLVLLRLIEGEPRNKRAAELARRIDKPTPYVTYLPDPGDASCNGLDDIFHKMFDNPASHHGSTVRLRLSHLESPSVVAAFWLQMEMWGPQVALDYQVETQQQPDPRQPRAQVGFLLWQWEGTQPRQAVGRPDPRVVTAIHALACEPFNLEMWIPRAQQTARELGPDALPQVLATMVYPPRPPNSSWRVLPWTQRAQVACALVVAFIDGGWAGSRRQHALYSLLYGPSDWTVGAAMVAMGALARDDAQVRAEVLQAFGWMRSQVPAEGFCPWEYPLVCTWLALGGHDDATRADLEQWRKKVVSEKGKSTVLLATLEAPKFDQAAEMARAQTAQQQLAAAVAADLDPMVFPGGKVPRLSDYVALMKQMQGGNMMGALAALGLDFVGYGQVAQAWGQKLAADPVLNARFAELMAQ